MDQGQLYKKLLDSVANLENQYNERHEAYVQAAKTIEELGKKIGLFSESFEIIPDNEPIKKLTISDISNNVMLTTSSMGIILENSEEMNRALNRRHIESPFPIKNGSYLALAKENVKFEPIEKEGYITIGQNGTEIKIEDYNKINWKSASAATRTLLSYVFDAKTLATHSLSGRPSPAFVTRKKKRPVKNQLDSKKVHDIVNAVRFKFEISERDVRAYITTKCADAAKLLRYKARRLIHKKI